MLSFSSGRYYPTFPFSRAFASGLYASKYLPAHTLRGAGRRPCCPRVEQHRDSPEADPRHSTLCRGPSDSTFGSIASGTPTPNNWPELPTSRKGTVKSHVQAPKILSQHRTWVIGRASPIPQLFACVALSLATMLRSLHVDGGIRPTGKPTSLEAFVPRSSSGGSRYMYPPVVLEEKELWWSASANAEKVQFLPAGQVERSYRMEWRRSYRAGIYLVH